MAATSKAAGRQGINMTSAKPAAMVAALSEWGAVSMMAKSAPFLCLYQQGA
jgi:hypothetical protein